MLDTLTGFAVVGLAIVVGYVVGRSGLLGDHARFVLSRLTFFVLSPFLLFTVLAEADAKVLFSALLPVSAIAAAVVIGVHALVARLAWRRDVSETVIGALSAGQVNANNIGIPLSLYLLGSAAYSAPVVLMQLLVFTPVTLTILDAATRPGRTPVLRTIGRTAVNPMIVGSVLGTIVSVTGVELPPLVLQPVELIANACVPVLLISYGISLHGRRLLAAAGRRRDVLLAAFLKLLVMPLVAWVAARYLFGLSDHEVLIVVVLAALPTAQNVFNYSQRYDVGEPISRDTVLITTIGCVPVLLTAALVLG